MLTLLIIVNLCLVFAQNSTSTTNNDLTETESTTTISTTLDTTKNVVNGKQICRPDNPLDCNRVGICSDVVDDEWKCICDPGYLGPECEIKQKQQLTAFLLSFFLGTFGAGRFYLGFIAIAVSKLLIGILACCCGGGAAKSEDEGGTKAAGGGCALFGCIISIWWIVDWIIIAANATTDFDGNPMMPW